MNARILNLLGAAACAGLMAYALYAQHVLGLYPCPLCIFQRVAVIALGVVFLLAAAHPAHPLNRRIYALFLGATALAGMGVSARHLWVQSLPADQVPACGPGLDFIMETLPVGEAVQMVLAGSGECHAVTWRLLGLSMPGWVLIALLGLGAWGALGNWRLSRRPG